MSDILVKIGGILNLGYDDDGNLVDHSDDPTWYIKDGHWYHYK